MVRDNVTGLIWEVKESKDGTPDDNNLHDADNTYTWFDGVNGTAGNGTDTLDFIDALNNAEFGGYNDWRLPTVKELMAIVDQSRIEPAINTDFFPNTNYTQSGPQYWSFTHCLYWTEKAFPVNFRARGTSDPIASFLYFYVRAVRGEQFTNDFIDNGNGTVTDRSTGLMWEQKTEDNKDNKYYWDDALDYCESLSWGGYNDWRLPNISEVHSILDYSTFHQAMNTIYFPNTVPYEENYTAQQSRNQKKYNHEEHEGHEE